MAEQVAIFGATSQIAADVARLYAARGARLYLVGRSAEKLEALSAELGPCVVGSVTQDFDRTFETDAVVHGALHALGHLDVALIAHGLLGDQLLSERDVREAEQITATNYTSVMALVIPLANYFDARGGGHLAVLSSVAAERGRPRNYTYAAAKAAINVYLQGVRSRLYARGVKVHALKLGPVDTVMTVSHDKNVLFSTSPAVAAGIVRAIDRDRAEAFVPGYWRYIMWVVRNMPEAIFQRIGSLSGR
jgi:decaprenylphospho-beta-D-erythro-pentofuranosid-2-ulose 2-reductase